MRSVACSIEELPTAGLRLRQLGFAAISDHLLGRFDLMKGHSSQRGGAKGPTHAIVYRFIMTILKRRPCITGRAAVAEDGLFVTAAR